MPLGLYQRCNGNAWSSGNSNAQSLGCRVGLQQLLQGNRHVFEVKFTFVGIAQYGRQTVVAGYNVEGFSLERLETLTEKEIESRLAAFRTMITF